MQRLPSFRTCYFCGTENRSGFGIAYFLDPADGRVEGTVEPDEAFCGYPGILHGGLQSALLDDVMYWAVSHPSATSSVTLDLRCRFRKTARLGGPFGLRARARPPDGRKVEAAGWLLDGAGEVVAEATGLYLLHPREVFERDMLPLFDFGSCDAAMVAHYSTGSHDGE